MLGFLPTVGPQELVLLAVVLLAVFGPKRLPEIGRSLGRGLREFKDSVAGIGAPPPVEARTKSRSEAGPEGR